MSKQQKVTQYQERVYTALQMIPEGRVTTYAAISKALNSSPRAVGGALRVNPFCPEFVGGYKGDCEKAPSGQNQDSKLQLLKEEGVSFNADGFLVDKTLLWDDFDVEKLK
ncbi:hypothetical protein J4E86_007553 [Alternaria arbusti]|uniref:uncharacterized protein n=1 Tax=Alternaria arbusti TaxID=232088 RepID=UPI00221ECF24|nr:uncharacterized protein J4E86_007553 [Alternaria arbusti]KAI4951044.1 hypothetical protein J4E86_007553 [Alternaria arbusti]